MIVDLLEKVLNRLIAYRDAKQRRREDLLRQIVDPLFEDLGKVHETYLSAFREFRRDLGDGSATVEDVLRRVNEERLFTQAMRTRVRSLAGGWADTTEVPELATFCKAVIAYLTLPNNDSHLGSLAFAHYQRWFTEYLLVLGVLHSRRSEAAIDPTSLWTFVPPLPMLLVLDEHSADFESELQRLCKADRLSAAVALLDALVLSMENEYSRVCTAYAATRAVLFRGGSA